MLGPSHLQLLPAPRFESYSEIQNYFNLNRMILLFTMRECVQQLDKGSESKPRTRELVGLQPGTATVLSSGLKMLGQCRMDAWATALRPVSSGVEQTTSALEALRDLCNIVRARKRGAFTDSGKITDSLSTL